MNMLGEAKVHQSVLPRYISKLRKYIPHIRYMPQAEQVRFTMKGCNDISMEQSKEFI